MSSKPKVAFYWCASCGGCEEAVVDLAEDILEVVKLVDIVFWPVAMDFKKRDVEALPDKSINIAFINGAIRTSEQKEIAHLLREKSHLIVAFGSCACFGGIPALANLYSKFEVLNDVYIESPTVDNDTKLLPQTTSADNNGKQLELPKFYNQVRALDEVISVDYYLPGCAPTPKLIANAVNTLLGGNLPAAGSTLLPDIALCEECPRKDSKPTDLSITEYKRICENLVDSEKCLLAQGFLCLGPVTRGGCEALCINGNMPCTGCTGPTSRIVDFGAKAVSMFASLSSGKNEEEIEKNYAQIIDPVGTFYRYHLSKSLLKGKLERGI
ncbi:MAG TPA: oxidoreductase [Candidatus Hydrogenedens sp.]|nr:oxidoreductase [Candidatus Hydrogenedens sp.]